MEQDDNELADPGRWRPGLIAFFGAVAVAMTCCGLFSGVTGFLAGVALR